MAAKAANRVPCPPPLPTLDFAPAFEVYTELGIDLMAEFRPIIDRFRSFVDAQTVQMFVLGMLFL